MVMHSVRQRRAVNRLDPSPECVAPWNDTSRGPRSKPSMLQQRTSHGSTTSAAVMAAAAAAACVAHQRQQQRQQLRQQQLVAPTKGRKRPRPPDTSGADRGTFGVPPSPSSTHSSISLSALDDGEDETPCSSEQYWKRGDSSEDSDESASVASSSGGEASDDPCFTLGRRRRRGGSSSCSPPHSSGSPQPLTTDDEARAAGSRTRSSSEAYPTRIRVRLARCRMPYRWAEPLPPFVTCLNQPAPLRLLRSPSSGGLVATDGVLRGALYGDSVDDESWLTSSFIDMVLAQFAACYRGAHFMPIEFAAFRLARMGRADMAACTDILGQTIDYAARKPIIFLANVKNLHWNLLRVQHFPVPELQLFEPLGKPAKRAHGAHSSEGVSYRYIPKDVFVWLDTMCARGGGWATRSVSAITRQQQTTGFDCGVASLLYAEKCGQDQMREDIDAATTQDDITAYRQVLQKFLRSLAAQSGGGDGADGGAATALPSPSSPAAAAAAGADFLPPLSSPPLRSGATAAAAAVDTIDLVDDSAVQLQMPPHAGSSGASAAGAAAAGSGSSGSSSVIA